MSAKILVLGPTGNIGAPLVAALAAGGQSVRAASRKKPSSLDRRVEWLPFDFADEATHARAFEGVERLFLLLPVAPEMPRLGEAAVAQAVKSGLKRIVKISALGASADAPFTFGRWHHESDRMVEQSGIPYTILRPNGFMQNYASAYGHTIRTQNAFYVPTEEGRVSLVDARDIAAVAATVLTRDGLTGHSFDVTGPQALSNQEAAQILSQVTGRTIRFLSMSENDSARAMKAAGLPDWLVNALLELYASYKVGEAEKVTPTVRELTGRAPLSFEQFARDYRAAFMPAGNPPTVTRVGGTMGGNGRAK